LVIKQNSLSILAIANPHCAAGDELSILKIRSSVFFHPCMAGLDTGKGRRSL
jgi:hypothetical protein